MALVKALNDPQRGQDYPNAYAQVLPSIFFSREAKVVQFTVLWFASEEHRRLEGAIALNEKDPMNFAISNSPAVMDDITGKERFAAQNYYDRHFGKDAPQQDDRPLDEWLISRVYAFLKDAVVLGDPRITAFFAGVKDA